jgi:hypothetical protein
MQTTPATTLDDIYKTLRPQPLVTAEELAAFYRPEINQIRGGDKMKRIRLRLNRAANDGIPFKACVMGHRGVGKSTELSRLIHDVEREFSAIRFSALDALDPGNFRPLDVVIVMMVEIAERTARPIDQGGAGQKPSDHRLKEIWEWFASDETTRTQAREMAGTLEAGVGIQPDTLWGQVLGLFAALKGEIKYASTRESKVVEYRISRLTSLIEVANKLLRECNDLLKAATGKQWLFVGEDFDRAGIPSTRIEELFITYANIFQDLHTHLIFNLPIGLYYSASAPRLPFPGDCSFVIPDTPVYQPDHSPRNEGREALQRVLESRMALDLFEPGQMMRLIVASGGNLRDLFSLVNYAADTALLQDDPDAKIGIEEASAAIANLRSDYERRLGQSPFDKEEITYDDKAARLQEVYGGQAEAQITDPAIYALLNARAVQEFVDGQQQRWFGVHPLVVDILAAQERIQRDAAGEARGGSI